MADETGFSREDYASMSRAGEILHAKGWRKVFTVAEMADKWAWLVGEVERGYDDMVDEYTNDLYCRNWLAEAWPMLTHPVRAAWHAEIQPLDERFRAATVDDDGEAISRYHRIVLMEGWWWRRKPRKLLGSLASDLAEMPDET
ncbi:hypothetical protein ACIA8R_02895 [Nonomuraea sp. NPDC051191]|uniref:hypothetical protein n=1 Tax=Nonomuraea sp. NPDC051191 TaxID=3364372 RepID=UPI0037B5511C